MRRRNRKRWRKAETYSSKADKCETKWCRNRRVTKYTNYRKADGTIARYESQLKYCWKCQSRQLRERHPHTYVLNMLRHSARKRHLPFTLTLAEFKEFCRQTDYLARRGTKPGCLTIDRIDWNEGYHIWNIQVMEFMDNSSQGADKRTREERGAAVVDDNEPF